MRRIVYHKTPNVDDSRNPHLLVNSDIQAFHVCREFLQRLRTGSHKSIEDANPDLGAYFNYIRREWRDNEYYSF